MVFVLLLMACVPENPQDIAREVDAYLTDLEQSQGFSGSVLIAREGSILINKGYGMADRDRQIPNTPQTRYRISQVSMPFTAMAIMQLQEESKLDVQETICKYIPDCPDYWQWITIHHLLTHTSGVSDAIRPWGSEADKPKSGLERVELINHNAPYFQPGEKLRYSENGYVILGAISEEVSGQTYERYLDTHIFELLGMENSGYEGEKLAAGYSPTGTKVPNLDVLFGYSAGGLYSTVEDLYLWDQALYGDGLISGHNLDTMFTGYALTPSMDFKGAEYGYGWFIGKTLDRRLIFHGGAMSGYTSGILRFPDERVTIVVLRNYGIQIYDRLEIELAKIVFGEE